jgi:hypothetical protein
VTEDGHSVESTDQEMYDQLLGYLAADGSIVEDPEQGSSASRGTTIGRSTSRSDST